MPNFKATKVLFDIVDAVKKLSTLDKKVKETGKVTKESFKKASTGVDELDDRINKLRARMEKLRTNTTQVKGAVGGAGIAFGIAAGAVIGATAAVLDFNNSLRDGEKVIGDWISAAREVREAFDNISASQDARRDFQFLDAKEAIAEQRLALTQLQIQSDARTNAAADAVSTEQSKLSRIESALKASHRRTLDAEKRLADKRKELAGDSNEFADQAKGRKVGSLASKAKQLAKGGKVEEAEALIEKAKELSAELGNHKFFTDQIDSANNSVVKALEKNVETSKKEETTLEGQLNKQKQVLEGVTARRKEEEAIKKLLADQIKLLGAQSGFLATQRKKEKQLQRTDQGAREVTSEQTGIKNEITNIAKQSGLTEGFKVLFNQLKRISLRTGFGSGQDIEDARNLQGEVLDTASRAATATTPGQLEAVEAERAALIEALNTFRAEIKTGERSGAASRDLDKLAGVLEGLKGLGKTGGNLGAVGENESIQAAQIRQREQADNAQQQAKNVSSQITINANVKGGVFDNDTLKQIEDKLRRIARQELAKANKE